MLESGIGLYYLLSVLEHVHWLAVFVASCAFVAMCVSKIAQADRRSPLTVRIEGASCPEDMERRTAFQKACFKWLVFSCVILVTTPPIQQWAEQKAYVQTLKK